PIQFHLQAPDLAVESVLVAVRRGLWPALAHEQRCRPLQDLPLPLADHHGMHTVLLADLVERLGPTYRLYAHLGLEFRAVNLAFPDLCHAVFLLGLQLKPLSRFWGPL